MTASTVYVNSIPKSADGAYILAYVACFLC
jgi:hypothetical protein